MLIKELLYSVLSVLSLGIDDFFIKDSPRVRTKQGVLIGRTMTSRKGLTFFSYQGIPYAAPPVNQLRFKPPEDGPVWEGERSAREVGSPCPHLHLVFKNYEGEEDCLYLNVYTPKLDGSDLSVMVFMHGGSFTSGSGSTEFFGPHFLLDQNIAYVSFNYRLGVLGFFSLNSPDMPGNFGMKDQVAALRWVKENIASFGGNPNSITIFGESAGAASVHLHMLSPLAKGLFHRAIAQSGSAFSPWAFTSNLEDVALNFTSRLGCDKDVIKCLQDAPIKSLVELDFTISAEQHIYNTFRPTIEPSSVEGAFLTSGPHSDIVNKVPLLTGYTTHDGFVEFIVLGNRTIEQAHEGMLTRYLNLFPGLERETPDWLNMRDKVKQFYKNIAPQDETEQFLLLSSDALFELGVDKLVSSTSLPVFYYQFSYEGRLGSFKLLAGNYFRKGTAHSDDLGYLMSNIFSPEYWIASPSDRLTIHRMTKMWTNFAKTGFPTPDTSLDVSWFEVDKTTMKGYLEIGSTLIMHKNTRLNKNRYEFFNHLRKEWENAQSTLKECTCSINEVFFRNISCGSELF